MQTPKEGDGRRPLLVPANSRLMLQEVNKSLSHAIRVQQLQQQHPNDNIMQIKGDLGVKPELSKSTPNMVEKPTVGKSLKRFGYNQRAMAQIKQSLEEYQNNGETGSIPNGYGIEVMPVNQQMLRQLTSLGIDEELASHALKLTGNESVEHALQIIKNKESSIESRNGFVKPCTAEFQSFVSKGITRKASFEQKYRTDSPVNSENSSIRSDSPGLHQMDGNPSSAIHPRGMPIMTNGQGPVQPLGIGQNMHDSGMKVITPLHGMINQGKKHASTVQQSAVSMLPLQKSQSQYGPITPQRGTSPMPARQTFAVSNQCYSPIPCSVQQNNMMPVQDIHIMTSQPNTIQRVNNAQNSVYNQLPPYSQMTNIPHPSSVYCHSPSTVQAHTQISQVSLPNQVWEENSPLPRNSSATALSGADLSTVSQSGHMLPKPAAVQAWSARQPPIFMLEARSREVQKPVLQTATAPLSPPLTVASEKRELLQNQQLDLTNYVSSIQAQVNSVPGQVFCQSRPQQQQQQQQQAHFQQHQHKQQQQQSTQNNLNGCQLLNTDLGNPSRMIQIHIQNQGPGNVHILQSMGQHPSGFGGVGQGNTPSSTPCSESPIPRAYNQSPLSVISTTSTPSTNSDMPEKLPPPYPGHGCALPGGSHTSGYMKPVQEELDGHSAETQSVDSMPLDAYRDIDDSSSDKQDVETHHCTSPKPQRSQEAAQRDLLRQETTIRPFSPQAYKFYMEQHFENLIKSSMERAKRKMQLEQEMDNIKLSEEARQEVRKMLRQKESNYIRLKRAKIDKSMFEKITTLGVGAFGEVALVLKKDTRQLLAMKTLRKKDVYQRNQVAHVKAERDILAEADNEWVVKLYYSFQDADNLYFVMDYIPGGDMMSLLIKLGIFEEPLARFYIAELVLAIESVHNMGFIHRDIKPDNILIDRDGHIKLTDFGLCTGFRWTHSSNLYQNNGNHSKQDSMEPNESWGDMYRDLQEELRNKPLERRKLHHRCLAHSLVGTPNYIAPEVLLRSGYTACCDWWSVGVILYEMLVGQPPFLAITPAETQFKVINYAQTLHIPPEANLSKAASDLICSLCTGHEQRLGRNGAEAIKAHQFFDEITDFEHLRQQQAPYKPTIQNATDTSNFDPIDSSEKRYPSNSKDSGVENGKNPDHAFFEFTFRRFFDNDTGNAYAQRIEEPESNSAVYV